MTDGSIHVSTQSIHFRVLNRRKGPAVWGPRAQADRALYKASMQRTIATTPNLVVVEGSVDDLVRSSSSPLLPFSASSEDDAKNGKLRGVKVKTAAVREGGDDEEKEILAEQVVVTTGTFMRGKCFFGAQAFEGGRHSRNSKTGADEIEPPSCGLAETFDALGFPLGRLKTGTPPRLDGKTINWDVLEMQPSEDEFKPFSFLNAERLTDSPLSNAGRNIECYKTYTNEATHDVVRANLHNLPEYQGGLGAGVGPRYCPSLVKKVERFPDRQGHMVSESEFVGEMG